MGVFFEPLEELLFLGGFEVDDVDQGDRPPFAGVVAAFEDLVTRECVGGEPQFFEDRGFEVGFAVVEGEFEFGQTEHGFTLGDRGGGFPRGLDVLRCLLCHGVLNKGLGSRILLTSYLCADGGSMEITRLSSKGQVIIPKALRAARNWVAGQELIAIDIGDGILLRPRRAFRLTSLVDVAGCLKYEGAPKSLEDWDVAVREGVREQWHDRG